MRCFQIVGFLLLFRGQQRTNLRHCIIHYRMSLLHRFLMDRDNLRFGLIKDWLDFGLLIGCQVEILGQSFEGKCAPTTTVPFAAGAHAWISLRQD